MRDIEEIWKDIEDYKGEYQVSNLGRVKSLDREIPHSKGKGIRKRKGMFIKTHIMPNGYEHIVIRKDGKQHNDYIHRLVAKAFCVNVNNLSEVNHIDENKENNCADNLEWCTHEYNMCYGTLLKRQSLSLKEYYKTNVSAMKGKEGKRGKDNKVSIPIYCITTNEYFDNARMAMEQYNVDNSSILKCCKGKAEYAGSLANGIKLIWSYYSDYISTLEDVIYEY